jgi:folate-dependent phosphoribosylglycinamide formyltransferase PurN
MRYSLVLKNSAAHTLQGTPGIMNIVVITNHDSLYGRKILAGLKRAKIRASAVVIHQPFSYNVGLFRSVARRVGFLDASKHAFRRLAEDFTRRRELKEKDPDVLNSMDDLAHEVVDVPGTNASETQDALRKLGCDLLLLGQCGIIRRALLSIPKLGTLNAHPGCLPWYRGLDSCKWAILENRWDRIGITVHLVDEGVDTGPIVVRQTYKVTRAIDCERLEWLLFEKCAELLIDVVHLINVGSTLNLLPQTEGKQYFKMHSGLLTIVNRILAGRSHVGKSLNALQSSTSHNWMGVKAPNGSDVSSPAPIQD